MEYFLLEYRHGVLMGLLLLNALGQIGFHPCDCGSESSSLCRHAFKRGINRTLFFLVRSKMMIVLI